MRIDETKVKFSIIVPMYNVEKYIQECIDSVLKQTNKNFELILIDDASTDGSLEIAKQNQEKDNRIIVLTKDHGGLPQTRNYGLKIARGDYIILLDGDDYFSLDHLKKVNIIVDKYDCDMTIANNHINFVENSISKQVLFPFREDLNSMNIDEKIRYIFDKHHRLPASAVLTIYKKSFLQENSITYEEKYICSEDLDFFLHSISKVRSICFFEHEFYYYRQDNGGAMTKNMTEEMMLSRMGIYKKWYDYFYDKIGERKCYNDICKLLSRDFKRNMNMFSLFKSKSKNDLRVYMYDNQYIWIKHKNLLNNFFTQYYFFIPLNKQLMKGIEILRILYQRIRN